MSRITWKTCVLAAGSLAALGTDAWAQGSVAFAPIIGSVPDGAILNATPVVSADRRYVRLTVNPLFTGNVRFDTFNVPAAVRGGGIGGGFGGFGGGGGGGGGGRGGGGGGGFGGGFASIGVSNFDQFGNPITQFGTMGPVFAADGLAGDLSGTPQYMPPTRSAARKTRRPAATGAVAVNQSAPAPSAKKPAARRRTR